MSHRPRAITAVVAGAALTVVAALAAAPGAEAADHPHVIAGFTFVAGARPVDQAPVVDSVARGDTLTFVNLDPVPHSVTSDVPGQFRAAPRSGPGATLTFGAGNLEPGIYAYHCEIHPFMHGAFTVTP